jgi:DNA uptake protein ComE-like DNA-binding protein
MKLRLLACFIVTIGVTIGVVTALAVGGAEAQVSKPVGVADANTAPEKDLLAMPHMTPAIVKGLIEKRPFASITDLNAYLLSQKLTPDQTKAFYEKAFVPIKLNTATDAEILLVPGVGKRMVHEFKEYRPWKTKEQFIKEIGKYVGAPEAERLWRYVVID